MCGKYFSKKLLLVVLIIFNLSLFLYVDFTWKYIIQGLYFMVDLEIIGDTYNSQQLECVLAILVDICIFFDKWYLI